MTTRPAIPRQHPTTTGPTSPPPIQPAAPAVGGLDHTRVAKRPWTGTHPPTHRPGDHHATPHGRTGGWTR
jgi:hypothetical protein